jgi:hypothetical protein
MIKEAQGSIGAFVPVAGVQQALPTLPLLWMTNLPPQFF